MEQGEGERSMTAITLMNEMADIVEYDIIPETWHISYP